MTGEGAAAALSIGGLSIRLPDGRVLLRDVDLTIERGSFVLLVGPSGAGKSTLLKKLAGLGDTDEDVLDITGSIHVGNADSQGTKSHRVGMVFQNLALFDELTSTENVQFALDHRKDNSNAQDHAIARLQEMGVPVDARIRDLSGGERQRVAVARTLAMDPPILFFDEPTTGLDPYRSRAVAGLIADTHQKLEKTVVVVTHDYEPFLQYNPRLLLIDPIQQKIREVTRDELVTYFSAKPAATELTKKSTVRGQRRGLSLLSGPGEVMLTLGQAAIAPFASWNHAKWKTRYLWHYLRMAVLGSTLAYVGIAGAMIGFVIVFFGFSQIPYEQITVPLLNEEFLSATGYGAYRVIVPLLIGILVACKCGAAVAADVGARRLTHQFEAMRSLGADPNHYLYGNIALVLAVGTPILTIVAFLTTRLASLVAYVISSPQATVAVFRRNFMATVWPVDNLLPAGTGWLVAKMVTCGLFIAAIAYAVGAREKASSVDVSRDVGRTIFWSSLLVLAIHSVYAFIEY